MALDMLLGNTRLKENLSAQLAQGKTSHFYLISGPAGSGKHTLAKLLSAGLQCQQAEKPCLVCPACRKALADTHPDIITVDDPEKAYVPIELVRKTQADLYIRPNEGRNKIYIYPRAQALRVESQNALLKSLEEPPPYGVFILLTDTPEKLLPTIRSRCTLLQMQGLPEKVLLQALEARCPEADRDTLSGAAMLSGGYLGQALEAVAEGAQLMPQTQDFVEATLCRSPLKLVQTLVPMERCKRDALIPILRQWENVLQQALIARAGGTVILTAARELAAAREGTELLTFLRAVQKGIDYLNGNGSPAAICGWLAWNLR